MDAKLSTADLLTIFTGVIVIVIWLVRLEGKVLAMENLKKNLEDNIEKINKEHDELKTKMYDQLSTIKETLARLEGFLQANKKGD